MASPCRMSAGSLLAPLPDDQTGKSTSPTSPGPARQPSTRPLDPHVVLRSAFRAIAGPAVRLSAALMSARSAWPARQDHRASAPVPHDATVTLGQRRPHCRKDRRHGARKQPNNIDRP